MQDFGGNLDRGAGDRRASGGGSGSAREDVGGGGVRAWAAGVLSKLKPRLRPAARDYLTNSARQTTDSVDVVDSALRRIDRQLHGGTFTPQNEEHLYRVARKATITTAIDRSRAASAQAALLNPDVQSVRLAQHLDRVRDKAEAEALVRRLGALLDTPGAAGDDDRLMFFLRLRGADMKVIASQLNLSHDAARARWSRLCARLRERVEEGALDGGEDGAAGGSGEAKRT